MSCILGATGANATANADYTLRLSLRGVAGGISAIIFVSFFFLGPGFVLFLRSEKRRRLFVVPVIIQFIIGSFVVSLNVFSRIGFGDNDSSSENAAFTGGILLANPICILILIGYCLCVSRNRPTGRRLTSRRSMIIVMLPVYVSVFVFLALLLLFSPGDSQLACFFVISGWYDSVADTRSSINNIILGSS